MLSEESHAQEYIIASMWIYLRGVHYIYGNFYPAGLSGHKERYHIQVNYCDVVAVSLCPESPAG